MQKPNGPANGPSEFSAAVIAEKVKSTDEGLEGQITIAGKGWPDALPAAMLVGSVVEMVDAIGTPKTRYDGTLMQVQIAALDNNMVGFKGTIACSPGACRALVGRMIRFRPMQKELPLEGAGPR